MSTLTDGHSEVKLQVIWNRLLAIVEEAAQTLMRTDGGDEASFGAISHPGDG